MKCPECSVELEVLELDGLNLPSCPSCSGMWLDEETFRLGKDHAEPNAVWLDFELWGDPDRFRASHGPRPCPGCEQAMVQLEYGETKVSVDHCDRCRAVWLDGGEFKTVVAALRDELASMTSTDYLRASIDEAGELITGPERKVSEWKDLTKVLRLLTLRFTIDHPTLRRLLLSLGRSSPLT
jgi:Zn-finger nucleic acid-binding protein